MTVVVQAGKKYRLPTQNHSGGWSGGTCGGQIGWKTTMSDEIEFVTIAKVGQLEEGEGTAVAVKERMVALFRQNDQYFAIDDFCPHMGASLASGYLENGVVTCPWHAWRFCIHDGKWCDNPKISIDSFPVRVVNDEIQVQVRPKRAS